MKAAFHLLLIIIASIFVNNEVCALFGIGNKKKDEEVRVIFALNHSC